ncbi:MAG: AsmA family protein [Burkholderiaceae bacterium]|nr:AsmA family protein [Burkholderiaceae bacterium]
MTDIPDRSAPKRGHRLAIALAAVAGALALAVVAFVASFDANRYKPELVQAVRERTGRALSIDGDLSLTVLPRLGLSMGPARLSGPGGRGEFAQFDSAQVGVALWPLLSRRIVVERVRLEGLKFEGVRRRDGSTNLDDLFRAASPEGAAAPGPQPVPGAAAAALTVASVQLHQATIGWRDEAAGTEWRLQQADLEAGRIANGTPGSLRLSGRLIGKRPLVDVAIDLSTGYTVDFATLATQLADLDLKARGQVPGAPALDARLRASLQVDPGKGRVELADASLAARSGDGVEATLEAPALAIAEGGASGRPVRGRVLVDRAPHRLDLTLSIAAPTRSQDRIVFGEVKADAKIAGPRLPAGGVVAALSGSGSIDPERDAAELALAGTFDGSALKARLAAARFAPLALRYELQADRLDLDRFAAAGTPGASAPSTGSGGKVPAAAPAPPSGPGAAPPEATGTPDAALVVPAALAGLDASGSIRIGALKLRGIDASDVSATIRSGGGRIDVAPLRAAVFHGTVDASAALTEAGRHRLRMDLTGVDAGLALRALAGRDALEGRGNLSLDLSAEGRTLAALERSLDGNAALKLRDGAIKGVDLADVLRRVRQAIAAARGKGPAIEQQAGGDDRTAFSSLDASFVVRDGVARNDDLDLRSPLLRVGGAGQVDLPRRRLDYLARVSVVGTLSGQGGAELAALRGVTVPVQVSGPFGALSYRVDVAALAIDAARRELTRRLQEELLGKPAPGATEPSKPVSPRDLLDRLLRR